MISLATLGATMANPQLRFIRQLPTGNDYEEDSTTAHSRNQISDEMDMEAEEHHYRPSSYGGFSDGYRGGYGGWHRGYGTYSGHGGYGGYGRYGGYGYGR